MSRETLEISPELYRYYQAFSLREHEVLRELRKETNKLTAAKMQISPEQGQLMGLLIELLAAKKTLDIGTFTGYSALVVALSLPNDGKVITCDVNHKWTDTAKTFWKAANQEQKIELKIGPALDTLNELIANGEENTFDFIFIDADKNNYVNYYQKAYQLVRVGGLIAVDNVLWAGRVADETNHDPETDIIRKLNQTIKEDNRVTMCIIPIGDGLTLARKRI